MAIRLRCLVPSFGGMRVCKQFAFIGESLLASQRLDLSLNLPKQNKSNQIKPSVACISKIEFRDGSMHQIINCPDTTTVLGASLILRIEQTQHRSSHSIEQAAETRAQYRMNAQAHKLSNDASMRLQGPPRAPLNGQMTL